MSSVLLPPAHAGVLYLPQPGMVPGGTPIDPGLVIPVGLTLRVSENWHQPGRLETVAALRLTDCGPAEEAYLAARVAVDPVVLGVH